VIACATEPHLFITNLSQSPFNVGLQLDLGDFTLAELRRLADMYAIQLETQQLKELHDLLGGIPYLSRRALYDLAQGSSFDALVASAARADGPFSGHLQRILMTLAANSDLKHALREHLLRRRPLRIEEFYRLRHDGILTGETPFDARPRCQLYDTYLKQHFGPLTA
jgi:hypothetical protein